MMGCGMIAALAATVVGGCAQPGQRAERLGFEWFRNDAPGYARLVLSAPRDRDDGVELACQPRSGAVELTVKARPSDAAVLILRSGEVWNRYPAAGYADPQRPQVWNIQVRLAEVDPVLRALADNGELTIELPNRKLSAPNGFAPAHDFLAVCRLP